MFQTLRNKQPDQPHQLTAPEIWLLTDLTEDSALVDGFWRRSTPPVRAAKRSRARKDAGLCSKSHGEIGRVAAGAVSGEAHTTAGAPDLLIASIQLLD